MSKDIIINDRGGTQLHLLSSAHKSSVEEVEDLLGEGFLQSDDGVTFISKKHVIEAGIYVWNKKRRRGVSDKDLKQYIGLLVESDSAPGKDEEGEHILNCVTSTTAGIVSTLHGLRPYANTPDNDKPNWSISDIPQNISYAMRDPNGMNADIQLEAKRCSHEKDIVLFSPAGLIGVPKVKVSLEPPMDADDRHVIFIHWSPSVEVVGNLLADEGYIVGASKQVLGQYLTSMKAHKGSCGGGVFFKLDGTLAGIHQGIEHESVKKKGKVARKEIEALKEEKDAFTYFLGCDQLSIFLNDA